MRSTNKKFWIVWGLLTLIMAGYFGYRLLASENKSTFLIGTATYGHYQIEMACETCHTDAFGGTESLQQACMNCHGEELEEAHDSHPKKKFTDPRNADRVEILDARYCVSCHTEHQREQTNEMGLTLPNDYCYHCHKKIGEDRQSHKNLPYDSCASAGCHNFHDNRALYEDFLVEHAGETWLSQNPEISLANSAQLLVGGDFGDNNEMYADKINEYPQIAQSWQHSSHAEAGVNCGGCHADKASAWIEKPALEQCQSCHENEAQSFVAGKHGMRLSATLSQSIEAVQPRDSSLSFKADSLDKSHGCDVCHNAHAFDRVEAAVEACLGCHDDEHSLAYYDSPHGLLWNEMKLNNIPQQQAVSCASCHMPRMQKIIAGKNIIRVDHNQNANLRPNEKMIRPVCMQCHSLEFSIDALADKALIRNNFSGKPTVHIESIDWALKRTME